MRCDRLRRRPTICSKNRRSVNMRRATLQLCTVICTTFVPSLPPSPLDSPPGICTCAADIPAATLCPLHPILSAVPPPDPTPPVFSAKTTAAPGRGTACLDGAVTLTARMRAQVNGDDVQHGALGEGIRTPPCSSPSTRQLRLPFGNADPPQARAGERGEGCLLEFCCW
ncbi:hypothetical protein C8R45DRAFT_1101879 [Mycena sanguinolenta]|nr:hypothetical protein C8R45DRAFT_1101879 [Mycena sanguinolenta]